MISIIVCSKNKKIFESFDTNVSKTIGNVKYEVIRIDNTVLQLSICDAYNLGAEKSNYEILLFVHEDVEFRTHDWGSILINNFKDSKYLLLGLAGSIFKTKSISSWWQPKYKNIEPKRINIIELKDEIEINNFTNPNNEEISEVISIDGVFMATKRITWDNNKFNSNLAGFHSYDLDYSIQVGEKGKVGVIFNIDIVHFGLGILTKQYFENQILVHNRFNKILALSVEDCDKEYQFYAEKTALISFVKGAIRTKISYNKVIKFFFIGLSNLLAIPFKNVNLKIK